MVSIVETKPDSVFVVEQVLREELNFKQDANKITKTATTTTTKIENELKNSDRAGAGSVNCTSRGSDSGHGDRTSSDASSTSNSREDLSANESNRKISKAINSTSQASPQNTSDQDEEEDEFELAPDTLEDLEDTPGDPDGILLKRQLDEVTVILKMALNNEFARALEICASRMNELYFSLAHSTLCFLRCALTLEKEDLKEALSSINHLTELSSRRRRKTSTASMMMQFIRRPNYNSYTDEEIHAELVNSESLLLLALISFLADQSIICFVRGAFRIRSCYQRYKECIYIMEKRTNWASKEAKEHFESGVRMGHGIFNLLMSYLPRRILRLLEYVGFSGNRTLGIDELESSIQLQDGLRSVFSNLVILTYHTYIENLFGLGLYDLNRVKELNAKLQSDFPRSAFYYLFLGRYNQMVGDLDESIKSYQLCIEAQDDWKQFHSICHWEMMWCYTFQSNWKMAAYYSDLLRKQSRWSAASYTYQYAGFLYTQLIEEHRKGQVSQEDYDKRIKEVREIMELVPTLRIRYAGKTIPAEKFAITKADKFCKQNNRLTLPALEYMYIWNVTVLLKNNQKYASSLLDYIQNEIELLQKERNEFESRNEPDNKTEAPVNFQDDLCLAYLLKGMCLKYINRHSEAEQCFVRVVESEEQIREDRFLIPHSVMELAILKLDSKQYEQSKQFVRMARDDYTGYLLESIVHFRLHSTLRSIKIELQEQELLLQSSSSSTSSVHDHHSSGRSSEYSSESGKCS